jgi:hypothetical protein
MLGRRVSGVVQLGAGGDETVHGGDVDDAAATVAGAVVVLAEHDGDLLALAPPDAVEVDVEDAGELFLVDLVRHPARPAHAGVVDRHVQPPEPPHRLRHPGPHLPRRPHVQLQRQHFYAWELLPQRLRRAAQKLRVYVRQRQPLDPVPGEAEGRMLPDSWFGRLDPMFLSVFLFYFLFPFPYHFIFDGRYGSLLTYRKLRL